MECYCLELESRQTWPQCFPLILPFRALNDVFRIVSEKLVTHKHDEFCGGAAIAVEAGDVTLFNSDLRSLGSIVRLGWTARSIIFFNITLAVVTKVRY